MIYRVILLVFGIFLLLIQSSYADNIFVSDVHTYHYIARELLGGGVLYRDLFHTNLPVYAYAMALYHLITGGVPAFIAITSTFEVIIAGLLIFEIAKKLHSDNRIALLSSFTYFASYTTLANLLPVGVTLAIVFFLAGYVSLLNNKYFLSGIFFSLAVGTKAFTAPVFAAALLDITMRNWRNEKSRIALFIGGATLATFIYMKPTLMYAFPEFIDNTFGYSLGRPAFVSDFRNIATLLTRDFVLVGLFVYSFFLYRKNRFIFLSVLLQTVFFIFYQDRHFVYFTLFIPLAVFAFGYLAERLGFYGGKENVSRTHSAMIIYSIIVFLLIIWHLPTTVSQRMERTVLPGADTIREKIIESDADYLYGLAFAVQGLSIYTGVPMLNNLVDTTASRIASGRINIESITEEVKREHVIVVIAGSRLPEGRLRIQDFYVHPETLKDSCEIIHQSDFRWDTADVLLVFDCKAIK